MMYTTGRRVRFSLFGTSHGPCVGCVLEGMPKGMPVDEMRIAEDMELRRPKKGIGTPRREEDRVGILQGVQDGKTDGTPILLAIDNSDTDGSKYLRFARTPRPGHADLPALAKFPGYDIRGGGQFSGRLTAPIVAAGSIAKQLIRRSGIEVSAFSRSIGGIIDDGERSITDASGSGAFATRACTEELDATMEREIISASSDGDSVGGVVECITTGLPIGFGGIWFEALDSEIAGAVFSIPACKGVEFGRGFGLAGMRGSESNDPFFVKNGIKCKTNNMGGILGGMSDGAPMVFRAVFKPTPSIAKPQRTVDIETMKNAEVSVEGRHDPCIVPRAVSVVEAVTALVLDDQMMRDPGRSV
ncbi:MAG: chorismate synthase [Candidatus Methanomethylophilaceae archaeon]|nr:chorismate synthase [Candidatus Methanomethylophilaceae archaeon]